MRRLIVQESALLLDYLFRALADTKKTRIREYLKHHAVTVNGQSTTRFDFPLKAGDKIEIETNPKVLKRIEPEFGVKIVCEDDALLVIDKPSGLLTIATDKIVGRNAFTSVNEYLNLRGEQTKSVKAKSSSKGFLRKKQIFLVHRLDRDTSGLLMFAKTEAAKLKLQGEWEKVEKKYCAVIEGVPRKLSGKIESFLTENKILRVYSGPKEPESKWAVTYYRILKHSENYSLAEIKLETGRKHQIRVHLALELGHPVAGDKDYEAKTNPIGRLCLHACSLKFPHPMTGKMQTVESKIPAEFEKILG